MYVPLETVVLNLTTGRLNSSNSNSLTLMVLFGKLRPYFDFVTDFSDNE